MSAKTNQAEWSTRILEIVNDGIIFIQDEDIVQMNNAFAAMLGYEEDEILDIPFEDLVDSFSKRHDKELLETLNTGKDTGIFNSRLISKTGNVVHVELNPVPVLYEGNPAVLVSVDDISKRVELEEAVNELENRFASLYDQSPIAYFTLNRRGVIEQINQESEDLLDCEGAEIIGRPLQDFFPKPEGDYDPSDELVKEILTGKNVSGIEIQMSRKDKRLLWVNVSSRTLSSVGEKPTEIALTAVDVTRRKAAEEKVRDEKQRADMYLGLMTNDLNNISHSALYTVDFLSTSLELSDHHREILNDTAWNMRRASRMIANMRALLTLTTNPPSMMKTDLYPHFERAKREADRDFESKTLKANSNIADDAFWVAGHAYVWSIFFNIIHNSMMYTEGNEIEIDVNAHVSDTGEAIRIEFDDSGSGVADELKERIFRRTDDYDEHLFGSGLGLTVVNQLVSDLHGKIWVEDRVSGDSSKGSKFVVVLPIWRDALEIPTITFFKSQHCVFCTPVFDSLNMVLDELGISRTAVDLQDVDDPASGVQEEDLPALPTIRIGSEELTGFISEDDLRSSIMKLIMES
ncbi:MAG: PAS domain S-box protein [Candidatus Thorarchaeota archaeon]|jgi:PAS domain S-box-containing protein